uniref:(northern house mosquito) hypothetical protein n=1 Tax=Culex pipiens TaxID=7175 RepID=A0A8D8MUR5_CULPI
MLQQPKDEEMLPVKAPGKIRFQQHFRDPNRPPALGIALQQAAAVKQFRHHLFQPTTQREEDRIDRDDDPSVVPDRLQAIGPPLGQILQRPPKNLTAQRLVQVVKHLHRTGIDSEQRSLRDVLQPEAQKLRSPVQQGGRVRFQHLSAHQLQRRVQLARRVLTQLDRIIVQPTVTSLAGQLDL